MVIDIFDPGASMILAALAMEAGLPNGVLNIVHGTHVSFSFVRSSLFDIYEVIIYFYEQWLIYV